MKVLKENWKTIVAAVAVVYLYFSLLSPNIGGTVNLIVKQDSLSIVLGYLLMAACGFILVYSLNKKQVSFLNSFALSAAVAFLLALIAMLQQLAFMMQPNFYPKQSVTDLIVGGLSSLVYGLIFYGIFILAGALIAFALRKYLLVAKK